MPSSESTRKPQVLLVEDDDGDVMLVEEGFSAAGLDVDLHRVENGVLCLKFLRRQAPFDHVPVPDLILLDLNMPVMSGHEVLEEMANDPALHTLRVVVLTTSAEERDVVAAYRSIGCSSYVQKPIGFSNLVTAISDIGGYWLNLVVTPRPST